jgi:hypothetical protein
MKELIAGPGRGQRGGYIRGQHPRLLTRVLLALLLSQAFYLLAPYSLHNTRSRELL